MFLQLTLVIQHVLFLVSFEHGLNKGFDRKKNVHQLFCICVLNNLDKLSCIMQPVNIA